MSVCSDASSRAASANVSGSASSWASSTSTPRSSSRERSEDTRATSALRAESREVTFCALSGSSHKSGAATASDKASISARFLVGSTTASMLVNERSSSEISV